MAKPRHQGGDGRSGAQDKEVGISSCNDGDLQASFVLADQEIARVYGFCGEEHSSIASASKFFLGVKERFFMDDLLDCFFGCADIFGKDEVFVEEDACKGQQSEDKGGFGAAEDAHEGGCRFFGFTRKAPWCGLCHGSSPFGWWNGRVVICVCEKAVAWGKRFWVRFEKRFWVYSFEREAETFERKVESAVGRRSWTGAMGGVQRMCFLFEGVGILLEWERG